MFKSMYIIYQSTDHLISQSFSYSMIHYQTLSQFDTHKKVSFSHYSISNINMYSKPNGNKAKRAKNIHF